MVDALFSRAQRMQESLIAANSAYSREYRHIWEALEWSRSLQSGNAEMPSAARAEGTSRSAPPASHGRRSTTSEDLHASPSRHDDAPRPEALFARIYSASRSSPLEDGSQLHLPYCSHYTHHYAHAPEEDGDASMVVVSSGDVQNNASAHHDTRDGPLSPAAPAPRLADMEVATAADATTQNMPALPGEGAPADHDAENNHDLMGPSFNNGLGALDPPISFADSANMNGIAMDPGFTPMDFPLPLPQPTITDERLTAFARLRFDDGSYYMHTYQIILGRNIALAHRDMRRLAKVDQLQAEGQPQAAEELLNGKKDKKKKRDRRGARSVISEKGGIVSAPIESMPMEYQQRRHSNASHSLSSASHPTGESGEEKPAERAPQDMIMQAFPEVPAQFDGHVPEDPNDCPVVPIHPQHITARTGAQGPKGISRHHAKIFYDFDNGNFCVEVLGSNGLHHENQFIHQGEIVPLDHGDHLLIGAVNIQFYLPDIALTEDQRHRQESGSRPMSFSFENGHGELESDEQISSESEGELSINPRHVYHYPVDSDLDSEDAVGDDDMDDYEEPVPRPRQKQSLKLKIKAPAPLPPSKDMKKSHKRKHREPTPEEPPTKKVKAKLKDPVREPTKESKASKEPKESKESKEKGKAPAKAPSKTVVKDETPVEEPTVETPIKEKVEPSKSVPNDSPPLLRKPFEGEIEAGEIEGLITEEMARQHNLPPTLIGHVVEKRKGPGRPPKDGIMSKRQRSQLIKQAKEIERAKAAGIDPADIPAPTIKPKAPKRKESNAADGDDDDVMETTEKGDGTISGDKKQAKLVKPPRTPSPEMRIEDYTEEQLQRPSANYVVLIHEAISSSASGQMNLQQIYNYIEKKYPWYKFKTTTSGWQSSVRHNLGQHDAFVKGDKEGKGFNWRVNPEVSIEKERRKRQVSPPINHAQRQPYYPPPNGYPPYPQPGYPYHPGMPHAMPQAAPRLPPSLAQPRLPPSMARDANATAPTATQGAPHHASPYASPWGGGNAANSPSAQQPPRPYPQPSSQTPPVSSAAGPSGQYGVLYPTTTQQTYSGPPAASPYGGQQYATAGASPYAQGPPRPYPSYPPQGQQSVPPAPPAQASASPYSQQPPYGPPPQGPPHEGAIPHPSGRYPLATHPDLIRQLEAFRKVYLEARLEPGEDKKVDNAIRACVDTTVPEASLTESEKLLLKSIRSIEGVAKHLTSAPPIKEENAPAVNVPATTSTVAAGTAAAIAADAVVAQQQQPPTQPSGPSPAPTQQAPGEPQKTMPNMTSAPPLASSFSGPVHPVPPSHRPSVEPLTPVPGSPAVQNGTPLKRAVAEINADTAGSADEVKKQEDHNAVPKAE
ncbi:Nn.00g013050.m01.CDS01 [Neocucurbitaria sp. VM-36]